MPESVLKHIDWLNVESTSTQVATSTSARHSLTENYGVVQKSEAQEVREMISHSHDYRIQPFLNIPLVKVVVRVQTQHMPVIQAERFELPHPQLGQSTGQNSSGIRQH